MDEEYIINKNINICFISGTIISEPDFKFFYNSKKLISKIEFLLKTESGFKSSKQQEKEEIKVVAYNEIADFIYQKLDINDKIMIKGFLEKDKVVVSDISIFEHK